MPQEPGHYFYHLTFEKRIDLEQMLGYNFSLAFCSRELEVSPSTIAREIKRNRVDEGHRRSFNRDHTGLCLQCLQYIYVPPSLA